MERDKELDKLGRPKESLGVFMHSFFLERTGLASYADVQMAQLLQVCEAQKKPPLPRIALFMDQIGLVHKDDLPLVDVRDTGFVLQILEQMALQGELAEAKQLAKKRHVSHKQMSYASFGIKADVLRSTAVLAMATVFKSWRLPDGGEEYLFKLRSMPHSEKGLRYVDIDEVINLMMEPWHIVRSNWEEHARYLFRENCIIFRAIQEAQFANDEAVVARFVVSVSFSTIFSSQSCLTLFSLCTQRYYRRGNQQDCCGRLFPPAAPQLHDRQEDRRGAGWQLE